MTPEEYLALPEEKPYLEYVDGMVMQKPMPTEEHSEVARELSYYLTLWLKKQKAGRAGIEARAKLGELPNYRLPDISYWKPGIPRGDQAPPTLAVEVRSPDQSTLELRRKCEFFRSSGVEACWIVDPLSRTAELFEGDRAADPIAVLAAECLPGFELPLTEFFAVLDD
jgi:Uma2 family endonuclease